MIWRSVRFRQFLLVVVLLAFVLLTGCAVNHCRNADTRGEVLYACYGEFVLLKDVPANNDYCNDPHYFKSGGYCLLQQTPQENCQQLATRWQQTPLDFGGYLPGTHAETYMRPLYAPQGYAQNPLSWPGTIQGRQVKPLDRTLCAPFCLGDVNCLDSDIKCHQMTCTPTCNNDRDCIAGVTTCEQVSAGRNLCVPVEAKKVRDWDANNQFVLNNPLDPQKTLIMVGDAQVREGVIALPGNGDSYGSSGYINDWPSGATSVMFWMRSTERDRTQALLSYAVPPADDVGNNNDNDAEQAKDEFMLWYDKDRGLITRINREGTKRRTLNGARYWDQDSKAYDIGATLFDGNWHHVAVSWGQSDGRVKVYLDGALQTQQGYREVAKGRMMRQGGTFVVGQNQNVNGYAAGQSFEGQMDNIKIYNYKLTNAQINNAKGSAPVGASPLQAILVRHWDAPGRYVSEVNAEAGQFVLAGNPLHLYGQTTIKDGVFDFPGNSEGYAALGTVFQGAVLNGFSNFPQDQITAMFWMKSTDTETSSGLLSYAVTPDPNVGDDQNNDVGEAANEFLLYHYRPNGLYVGINPEGGEPWRSNYYNVREVLFNGNWHHVAVTWSAGDGLVALYIDGVVQQAVSEQAVVAQGRRLRQGGFFVVGGEQDVAGGGFQERDSYNGQIDGIKIFNSRLTVDEINGQKGASAPTDVLPAMVCLATESEEGAPVDDSICGERLGRGEQLANSVDDFHCVSVYRGVPIIQETAGDDIAFLEKRNEESTFIVANFDWSERCGFAVDTIQKAKECIESGRENFIYFEEDYCPAPVDSDSDSVPDNSDNCPATPNGAAKASAGLINEVGCLIGDVTGGGGNQDNCVNLLDIWAIGQNIGNYDAAARSKILQNVDLWC